MRAGTHAIRFWELRAQVAHHRLGPRLGLLLARQLDHVDVAVGTIRGAVAAPDAPILDHDIERVLAPDGTYRTARHAQRIHAGAATRWHQEILEAKPVAH